MTIKEIAELAGVSISTVSKIVNDKDQNINPKTRARVLQIVKEYNYTPYGTVKNLSTSRTFLIGVLLNNISTASQMINGILQASQAHGYSILLLDSQDDLLLELKHITTLCKNRVDGVIWKPVDDDSIQYLHHFSDMRIPVCAIGNDNVKPSYNIDHSALAYALTKKLIDNRHTRISCLLRENDLRSQAFLEGYRKCLFDHQIIFDKNLILYENSRDYYRLLLESEATGAVSAHSSFALSLYSQLVKLHYSIPEDFSIACLKEEVTDQFSLSRISGIPVPYYEFGTYVCEKLITLRENSDLETDSEEYLFAPDTSFSSTATINIPAFLRSKKIVVVGSINTDFTFTVDHLPQRGKTTNILNSVTTPGGKGLNQAIGAARLGRQVSLIGEIGNDAYSSHIMGTLEKESVSTLGIHKNMNLPTGTAYIYIEKSGEGTITIQAGANQKFLPEKISNQQYLFEKSGYCLISTEIPMETVIAAAVTARKYDAKTIIKPAAIKEFPEELYNHTDILVPNLQETTFLCPGCNSVEEQAEYLLRKGIPTVIITLGDQGCYLRTIEYGQYFPASDFVAVDTTGGADAFMAALAAYLIEGYSLEKSIRIATYAAGFCVSHQGVVAGLVDRNTLEAHIKKLEEELL